MGVVPRVVVSVKLRGDGLGADFEVLTDTSAAELARQIAQNLGVPKGKGQLELRSLSLGRALRPDETFADAGLWDGATLILARAGDPPDQAMSLALTEAHTQRALLAVPPPPALAIPPVESQPRSPLPFVVLGVTVVAIVALGAWFFVFRQREPVEIVAQPVTTQLPTQAAVSAPVPTPPAAVQTAPPAQPQAQAQPQQQTPDEEAAWRALLAQLDAVWAVDWPASISLLQAFHAQYPTRTSATDKLYSALVEYARALRDAGAPGPATDELEQAIRLAPQRFEARDELAALQPRPTEVIPQPPVAAPPQPTTVPLPTRGPAPTLAPAPPPVEQAPDATQPTCDVRSPDIACPLADGARVQDTIAQPDGRHFYWFGVPTSGLQLHVEVGGQACPCTLLVFSDAVDNGNTAIAAAFPTNSAATVLDRQMPDLGPYLLEVVPDQNGAAEPDAAYALAFRLQMPATPTPVPVVEEPTPAPTPTPVPLAVPPVIARPQNEAMDRVRAVGLLPRPQTADRYSAAGPGTIAAQDPPAGALLPPGAAVTLLVASGNVLVPNVIGMFEQDAWTALHESGFEIDTRRARRSNVDAGRAADVNPGPGNALPAGSTVILTISQGP